MENTAIVVRNNLPAEIPAISAETMFQVSALTEQARDLQIVDVISLEAGNDIYRKIDRLLKEISSNRLEITRPIDALKKSIMTAEEGATAPLMASKKALQDRLYSFQKELERQAEEARKKARAEAEEKARVERERLEKERQAKIEADKKKAEEEAALFGTEPEIPAPPPPPVVVVPTVEVSNIPEVPKSAVRKTTRNVLVITDEKSIPVELAGVRLLVPDLKAIEKLMKAGIAVPGCKLEAQEAFASAGGRK